MDPKRGLFDVATIHRLPAGSFYVLKNGKKVEDLTTLDPNGIYQVVPRVLGGKGGFGSLLRSFKFYKSHNQGMCRDLSGRRVRDVNEEQRLREWISKKAEREREKAELKKEKIDKIRRGPAKHQFADPDFERQKDMILQLTDEAFDQGFSAADLLAMFQEADRKRDAERAEESSDDEVDSASDISDSELVDMPGTSAGWLLGGTKSTASSSAKSSSDSKPQQKDKRQKPSSSSSSKPKSPKREVITTDAPPSSAAAKRMKAASKWLLPPADQQTDGNATSDKNGTMDKNEKFKEQSTEASPKNGDCSAEPAATEQTNDEPVDEQPPKKKNLKNQKPMNPIDINAFEPIDVETLPSVNELNEYGMDHLKAELMRRGLKCGGSQTERVSRLWVSVRGGSKKNK